MSMLPTPGTLAIREYRLEDEGAVLGLIQDSLGASPVGRWETSYFRWKHLDNPFGQSFMLVAEADGRLVGFRAFMRWRFVAAGQEIAAVRAVDTATHPEYRRRGIFSQLTGTAVEMLRGETDLIFNTPNEKSLPGYLKMGWRTVGKFPVSVRVLRPIRVLRRFRRRDGGAQPDADPPVERAASASEVLTYEGAAAGALDGTPPYSRLTTPRTPEYLRWRYGDGSGLGYRAIPLHDRGRLRGLAVFRVRARGRLWESTVAEVMAGSGDRSAARRLLQRVARSTRVDHVACHVSAGAASAPGARQAGFLPVPMGVTFVVNVLHEGLDVDPRDVGSWNLSLGDLEVF